MSLHTLPKNNTPIEAEIALEPLEKYVLTFALSTAIRTIPYMPPMGSALERVIAQITQDLYDRVKATVDNGGTVILKPNGEKAAYSPIKGARA